MNTHSMKLIVTELAVRGEEGMNERMLTCTWLQSLAGIIVY